MSPILSKLMEKFLSTEFKTPGHPTLHKVCQFCFAFATSTFYFPHSLIKCVNTFRIILEHLFSTLVILILISVCVCVCVCVCGWVGGWGIILHPLLVFPP